MSRPALSHAERVEWLEMLLPSVEAGLVTVLKVAVDESGVHDNAPCICVAACVANPTQWAQFSKDWGPRAENYKEKGYHATNARDNDNEFLASTVARWLQNFAVTISYEDFKAVVPHEVKAVFGKEYVTAIRVIELVLRHYCDEVGIRWMTWVLEGGGLGEGPAHAFLREIENTVYTHVYGHVWVDKREIITHSADIVAFASAAAFEGRSSPLAEIMADSLVIRHFERDELVEAVEKGKMTIAARRWAAKKRKYERKQERKGED